MYQPNFTLLLDKHNALMWYRKYAALHHNVSSLTLRRKIFKRHRALIKDLELTLDLAFFVLSINDGYYLHIPDRLTFYRVGSGVITEDVHGDPTKVNCRLCTLIRLGYDKYILYNYVRDSTLKNVIESSGFTYHLILYWRFKPFIDCSIEIPLTKVDMLYHALRDLGSVHDTLSLRIAVLRILTTLLGLSGWGRRWLANLQLRRNYGIDLASLIQSQRD